MYLSNIVIVCTILDDLLAGVVDVDAGVVHGREEREAHALGILCYVMLYCVISH